MFAAGSAGVGGVPGEERGCPQEELHAGAGVWARRIFSTVEVLATAPDAVSVRVRCGLGSSAMWGLFGCFGVRVGVWRVGG